MAVGNDGRAGGRADDVAVGFGARADVAGAAVGTGVGCVETGRNRSAEEEIGERRDRVADVHPAVVVGIPAKELAAGRAEDSH